MTCHVPFTLFFFYYSRCHSDVVDPAKDCYWVTADYYQSAVEFISSMVELSTHTLQSMTTTIQSELMSEYSASCGQ